MKSAICILIILSLGTVSCKNHESKLDSNNLIPEKELISLLIDIHIANGLLSLPRINSSYSSLDSITSYYHVIEKHGYTKDMLDKTLKFYFMKNPKKLNEIYDVALGKLSEMETLVSNQSSIEQARNSNLWQGKDFYASPSINIKDTARINFTFSNPGFYKLAFTATVYPDDPALNPQLTIYSVSSDSLSTGKRTFINTLKYLKDGRPHTYFLSLKVPQNKALHFSGSLFDSNNHPEGVENHYKIENISVSYSTVAL